MDTLFTLCEKDSYEFIDRRGDIVDVKFTGVYDDSIIISFNSKDTEEFINRIKEFNK